jgi:hypothetical protein
MVQIDAITRRPIEKGQTRVGPARANSSLTLAFGYRRKHRLIAGRVHRTMALGSRFSAASLGLCFRYFCLSWRRSWSGCFLPRRSWSLRHFRLGFRRWWRMSCDYGVGCNLSFRLFYDLSAETIIPFLKSCTEAGWPLTLKRYEFLTLYILFSLFGKVV